MLVLSLPWFIDYSWVGILVAFSLGSLHSTFLYYEPDLREEASRVS